MDSSRLAWITDPHLNFVRGPDRLDFYRSIADARPDALLIGGDIAEAPDFADHLREMERAIPATIHFVLGNHDYYRGSVRTVEGRAHDVSAGSQRIRFLPEAGVVELAPDTALVGHGGWADGRFGDYARSRVELSDFVWIGELMGLDAAGRLRRMQELAEAGSAHFRRVLPEALERFARVIVLTHVPPFAEAAWYEGKMSNPDFLPFFSSKRSGDAILEAVRTRPDREVLVLCGHTHGAGEARVLPNLHVSTGGARYGAPVLGRVIDLGGPLFPMV